MTSISIEARLAVTAVACGVVGANCVLGALLLESRKTKRVKKGVVVVIASGREEEQATEV